MLVLVGWGAVLLLAFANGANDNSKPVATLAGAGITSARRALFWGTLATLAGSLLAILLGKALIAGFSAKGLVGAEAAAHPAFLVSVGLGATLALLLATRLGLPVSTTHALIGAIVGAGLLGPGVDFERLGSAFLLPLITSPLAALALTAALYPCLHRLRERLGIGRESCVCIQKRWVPVDCASTAVAGAAGLEIVVDRTSACRDRYSGTLAGVGAAQAVTGLHWLSALALSFGRGLQDGAKITGIGLLLAGAGFGMPLAAGVAVAMAGGGLLAARRVQQTMAHKITRMNDGQGLLANGVASALVFAATLVGLPVSTTHVTSGALMGVRLNGSGAAPAQSWLGRILLAWLLTLPLAALLASGAALALAI